MLQHRLNVMITSNVNPEATLGAIIVAVELYAGRPRFDCRPTNRAARLLARDTQPITTRLTVAHGQMHGLEQNFDAAEWRHHYAATRLIGRIVVGKVGRGDVRV